MIDFIEGTVDSVTQQGVVLQAGGVGYLLLTSRNTAATCRKGEARRLCAHLSVREDGMTLFGFADTAERAMFLKLIGIPSVGPKLGLAVLSGMQPSALMAAITLSDTKALMAIPGVGKKTAERIILELRETVATLSADDIGDLPAAQVQGDAAQEAAQALLSLGYTSQEATLAVAGASPEDSVEDLLKRALKRLAGQR